MEKRVSKRNNTHKKSNRKKDIYDDEDFQRINTNKKFLHEKKQIWYDDEDYDEEFKRYRIK